MEHWRVVEALNRPASALGVLPELANLRPKFAIHIFETLASTNKSAWDLVAQGAGAGTVVIARQQRAGRGQWGRTWLSPPGGLYLSVVLEPDVPVLEANWLTLASAWGVVTSLENLGIPIAIKWPNDLVYQGLKVGGILTETRIATSSTSASEPEPLIQKAVIGIGINWLNPPYSEAMSLKQLLPDPPPEGLKGLEDLAAIALRGLLQGYQYWQCEGTWAMTLAYHRKLSNLGQTITVDGHLGRIVGVSSTGDLSVSLSHQEEKCTHQSKKCTRSFKPGEITLGYNS